MMELPPPSAGRVFLMLALALVLNGIPVGQVLNDQILVNNQKIKLDVSETGVCAIGNYRALWCSSNEQTCTPWLQ